MNSANCQRKKQQTNEKITNQNGSSLYTYIYVYIREDALALLSRLFERSISASSALFGGLFDVELRYVQPKLPECMCFIRARRLAEIVMRHV